MIPALPVCFRTKDKALSLWMNAIQGILRARFYGKGLQRAVTFQDLVDMGVVDESTAQQQARS